MSNNTPVIRHVFAISVWLICQSIAPVSRLNYIRNVQLKNVGNETFNYKYFGWRNYFFFFRATNELDFPKMNRQDKWIKCDRIAWRFNDIEANVKV